MTGRKLWILIVGLTLAWAAGAVAAAWWLKGFGASQMPMLYVAGAGAIGALIGLVSALGLSTVAEKFPGLLAGGLLGHLALIPPAVRLAPSLGSFGSGYASNYVSSPAVQWVAYGIATAFFAVMVLGIGSALGMGMQAALRAVLGPLWRPIAGRWQWPSRKAVALTCVLAAVLAGAGIYAHGEGMLQWPEAKMPDASPWIEREKALYKEVLAQAKADVVVLPLQADGPTFDRAARALMTRYLAARMEERAKQRVADPTLVMRALDARARQLDQQEALALAQSTGARTALVGSVRRDGQTFVVRARLWTRDGDSSAFREGPGAVLEGLRFDDRTPPEVAFREAMDQLLDQLKIGQAPAAAPAPAVVKQEPAISELIKVVSDPQGTPLELALRLQLLASLHTGIDPRGQMLWERSLLALRHVERSVPEAIVLEARAAWKLGRRPYAVALLGEPGTPAGRALLAATNGDVLGTERALADVPPGPSRLMIELDLIDLYEEYRLNARLEERRKALLEKPAVDRALLDYRTARLEWFNAETIAHIAASLGRHAPGAADFAGSARAWARWLYGLQEDFGAGGQQLAAATERRRAPMWKREAARWAALRAADRPAEWDYYELLFEVNRSAAFKAISSVLDNQGLPESALQQIEALEPVFGGDPWFMGGLKARALETLGAKAEGEAQKRLHAQASALARAVYRWEGGESGLAWSAEQLIYELPYDKYTDEPPRSYRNQPRRSRTALEKIHYTPKELQDRISGARRRLEYSSSAIGALSDLAAWLRRAGQHEEASDEIRRNRHRFIGSPRRVELLLAEERGADRHEKAIALYGEALQLDAESWNAHWHLAAAYLEAGRAEEGQKLLLAYPGFVRRAPNDLVRLSNIAFSGGHLFYGRGAAELARPLFQLSESFGTGSARYMHARELLAVMQNDLRAAREQARREYARYSSAAAAARALTYSFLLGEAEAAWKDFPAHTTKHEEPQLWAAAWLGQRMQGMQPREVEAWLQKVARSAPSTYFANSMRERHAFMAVVIDRAPSEESLALIRSVANTANHSPFYPALAEGYFALRRGDAATAIARWRKPHQDLHAISLNRRQSYSELLPYMTLAYLRAGQPAEADKILLEHRRNLAEDADYLLAEATRAGLAGEHEAALRSLRLAFYRLPHTDTRTFEPGYTLLELCELLFKESGTDAYRQLIEEFSRRLLVETPHPWAAAFQARYAQDPEERRVALSAATILDPGSERLRQVPEAERIAAREAAERHASLLGVALRQVKR